MKKLVYDWYKLNESKLTFLGGRRAYKYFEKDHPGVYGVSGFRGIYEAIKRGDINEQEFGEIETTPAGEIEDVAPNFDTSFFDSNMIEFPDSWAESYVHFDITGVKNLGVCSDIHLPYHDPLALSACFSEFKRRNVDGIYLNGDIMDFEKISRFGKIPDGKYLKDEIEVGKAFIKSLRRMFPKIPIFWKDGNHERRLQSYINEKCPELCNMYGMDTATMMGLQELDITYVPENIVSKYGKLYIAHGHELGMGGGSVNIARQVRLRVGVNILVGHWHKAQQDQNRNLADETHAAWALGCLCYLKPRYTGALNQWTQSAATIEILNEKGEFRVNTFQIIDGKVI